MLANFTIGRLEIVRSSAGARASFPAHLPSPWTFSRPIGKMAAFSGVVGMPYPVSRRAWLASGLGAVAASSVAQTAPSRVEKPFGYCLNTSTVRDQGKHRPIVQLVEIAAKAGYAAIEPWIAELDEYVKAGNSLKDLKKRIADAGLVVPSAIGFAQWIVDDDTGRKNGLETAKRDMDWVAQIGGTRTAAPPIGATRAGEPGVDPLTAADRYRTLL